MLGWLIVSTGIIRATFTSEVDGRAASGSTADFSAQGTLDNSNLSNLLDKSRTKSRYASIRLSFAS